MLILDFLQISAEEAKGLTTLNLKNNEVGLLADNDFRLFCAKISECTNLKELNLFSTSLRFLTVEQFKDLQVALGHCSKLQVLDIAKNQLGLLPTAKNEIFCAIVSGFPNLITLNLSNNLYSHMIDSEFCKVNKAVMANKRLQTLIWRYEAFIKFTDAKLLSLYTTINRLRVLQNLDVFCWHAGIDKFTGNTLYFFNKAVFGTFIANVIGVNLAPLTPILKHNFIMQKTAAISLAKVMYCWNQQHLFPLDVAGVIAGFLAKPSITAEDSEGTMQQDIEERVPYDFTDTYINAFAKIEARGNMYITDKPLARTSLLWQAKELRAPRLPHVNPAAMHVDMRW